MNIAGKNVSVGAMVAGLGGVLAIVCSFLAWFNATVKDLGIDEPLNGMDKDFKGGIVELVLGIVVLALVVAWVMQVKIPAIGALVALAGIAVVVVAILGYTSTLLVSNSHDMSVKDMGDLYSAMGGSVSFGIGFLGEILAGVLAVVGGGLGLMKKA